LITMDHVSITVQNVDRSIKFYSEALGMKLLRVSVLNPSPETTYKNAYMYSGTFLLEMITADDSAKHEETPQTWQQTMRGKIGITHLGVRVRDLDAAVRKVKAAGALMIGEPFEVRKESAAIKYAAKKADPRISYARRPGKKPWRIAVFTDPDGVIIELVER